jgi:PucR family transcriptional regulator, purine catabolism regulatory protein
MSNSVGDLLELMKPFGARLEAGAQSVGRQVSWVHSSDLPDVGAWLRGGEVVLNTALHIDSSEAAETLLESLAKGGAAAVIFADDPALKGPARQTIRELGDRLQLPIIYIPVAVKFVDVTQTISRSIISTQYDTLRYWETIHERFIRSALEGRGTREVVDLLGEIMHREVGLVDSQLRTVTSTVRTGGRDQPPDSNGWLPAGLERGKVWKDVVVRSAGLRSVPDLGAWVQQIQARGDLLGLLLVRGLDPLSERDRIAIDQAAIALALELLKERELRDLDGRLGFELLADILSGKTRDYDEAQRRASFLGFDLTAPFQVLVIEESSAGRSSAALGPLRRRKQRFLRAIDWAQGPSPLRSMVMARSDALVVLAFDLSSDDALRRFGSSLISKLEAESPGNRFLGGLSGSHAGAEEIQPAYEEAHRAREIGSRLRPDDRVTSFDDLGIQGLILGLAGKELIRLSRQRLGGLERNGHGPELRQTVEAYLENEGSISRTATKLRIHRNTVLQRLQRVKAATGLDPQKVQDRVSLTILLTAEGLSRSTAS